MERIRTTNGDALAIDLPAAGRDSGGRAAPVARRKRNNLDGEFAQIPNRRGGRDGGADGIPRRRTVGGRGVAVRTESARCGMNLAVVRRAMSQAGAGSPLAYRQ